MNPIPSKLRKELSKDPYYNKCCLTGFTRFKIDWHHCFEFKGAQINEKWNILPVYWRKHSPQGDKDSIHNCLKTREMAELIALRRADKDVFRRYKKANFEQRLKYLEKKYG
ncbi:MAG TPA: hypothetical protein VK255_03255 [Patescibacteria group bacterium]|nr:hypothetical protein [Patescibacteria group bacterium]